MSSPEQIDLCGVVATGDGVAWSASPTGINVNLVVLGPGGAIGAHRNDEIDVLVVVISGAVTLTVDGDEQLLPPATAVVVPRGATRRIAAGADGARYLSIHRRREPLGVKGRSARPQ